MLDIGRAVENAQWLLLLQKQQCLVLERTGFGIFCRNDMSKMQTFWRSQHPPPKKKALNIGLTYGTSNVHRLQNGH